MARRSAGILLYRRKRGRLECLLGHPGGPFWARRDRGAWTIPKGEVGPGEEIEAAARREFREETGAEAPAELVSLGEVVQAGGKRVAGYAALGDFRPDDLVSIACEMEWPPRSRKRISFPELDRVAWLPLDEARDKIIPAQAAFLDRLAEIA